MGACCESDRGNPKSPFQTKEDSRSENPTEKAVDKLAPVQKRRENGSTVQDSSKTPGNVPTRPKSSGLPAKTAKPPIEMFPNLITSPVLKPSDTPTVRPVKFLKTSLSDKYRTLSVLSNDGVTKVLLVEHMKSNQKRLIRQIQKVAKAHNNLPGTQLSQEEKFRTEISIVRKLDHRNILKLFEVYEDQDNFYVVSEALMTGHILDHIVLSQKPSECMMARIMFQVLNAVHYCHINGVIHRNLNLKNLLLESMDVDENVHVKVSGFGMSCLLSDEARLSDRVGCANFIAPEVLKKAYNEKCDVWSCGVILYFLLSGTLPFTGTQNAEILHKVSHGMFTFPPKHWSEISSEAINLICKMLVKSPERRLSAAECIDHPWIQSFRLQNSVSAKPVLTALKNMKSFMSDQKLKQAVLTFIAENVVSKEETKALTESFAAMDTNGDGVLSREELINAYSKTMTREQAIYTVNRVMRMVDFDGSGNIDYSEFMFASMDRQMLLSESNLATAFSLFDSENSGKIPLQDFKERLRGQNQDMTDAEWTVLVEEIDINKDGNVDFEEFKALVKRAVSRKSV
jgi:calcium-dependent protein kinase